MRCLSRGSFKQAQTLSCPPTRRTEPPVQSYCCSHSLPDRQVHKFTPCSVSPTASLHTCDCRGSLYQLHILPATVCREGERKVEKKRAGWNIFQGSCHFLSDQPGAVGLQIKSVPKKKRRQQNTAEQSRAEQTGDFAFQPPPGKVPSSGKAGNFPWPTYSLSSVFMSRQTLLWDF